MRTRLHGLAAFLVLTAGGVATLAWTRGQDRPVPAPLPAAQNPIQPVVSRSTPVRPLLDLNQLTPLQQQFYVTARRGADWLRRANRADGRFVYGYVPALKSPLEGDSYLRQAAAAAGLARAARFFGDERFAAVARQAILTLLLDTAPDPGDSRVRSTTLPSIVVNRLGAAGLVTIAIHELPEPGDDLLEQSEQLCQFIRKQQRPDGSLSWNDTVEGTPGTIVDPDGVIHYPGQALVALMLSQRHRPAAWKTEVVRKAVACYRPWWRSQPHPDFAAWHLAACALVWEQTREQPFADFACEMSDWLCALQFAQLDPRHPLWVGGFMEWKDGKPLASAPQVHSARFAEGLLGACRIARATPDVQRFERYREAAERGLQFLVTLQYTDANTQHFADWYREVLVGGFHASHQDGNLRLDYTQQAVGALIEYLEQTAGPRPTGRGN